MIEIIVINRIGDTEFTLLFRDGNEGVIERFSQDGSRRMRIYNGVGLGQNESEIAEKIASDLPADCSEALIVIHSSTRFETIAASLLQIADGRRWIIRKYSREGDNYNQVSSVLQRDDHSSVDDIYDIFAPDRMLEAKLDLLHACLTPTADVELPKSLNEYSSAWGEFIEAVNPKSANDGQGADENDAKLGPVTDPLDEDYVKALTKLRNALLGN